MTTGNQLWTNADRQVKLNFTPAPGLLQRACDCGGSPGLDGDCAECRAQRLQRSALGAVLMPKLAISNPGDSLEHEADRIADAVVVGQTVANGHESSSSPPLQRCGSIPSEACPCHEAPPVVGEVLRSPGQPLDTATRAFMEPRFDHDFGSVRVHTDARAAESARAVNALAYTVGQDVVFGDGQYAPSSTAGQRLLTHELTHVVQQADRSRSSPQLQKSNGDSARDADDDELEARRAGETADSSTEVETNVTPVTRLRLLPPPVPPDLRVSGVGTTGPTMLLRGPSGALFDLRPYTGNRLLDFSLASLEALGIPILSYFHFHYGRAAHLRGINFRNVYALSGGTSFMRNAIFYRYVRASNVDLYGAPSSFSDHYDLLPNVGIHANPMDIGTMIHVDYFNNPLPDRPNNPTIIFSLVAPFDHNPLEAVKNLGGAIWYTLSGRLYELPGVTHSYPEFNRRPLEQIGPVAPGGS